MRYLAETPDDVRHVADVDPRRAAGAERVPFDVVALCGRPVDITRPLRARFDPIEVDCAECAWLAPR